MVRRSSLGSLLPWAARSRAGKGRGSSSVVVPRAPAEAGRNQGLPRAASAPARGCLTAALRTRAAAGHWLKGPLSRGSCRDQRQEAPLVAKCFLLRENERSALHLITGWQAACASDSAWRDMRVTAAEVRSWLRSHLACPSLAYPGTGREPEGNGFCQPCAQLGLAALEPYRRLGDSAALTCSLPTGRRGGGLLVCLCGSGDMK